MVGTVVGNLGGGGGEDGARGAGAPSVTTTHVDLAWAAAERAAGQAGIEVREVRDVADMVAVRAIFDQIWASDPTNPAATVEMLRAYAHTGQYVVVAADTSQRDHPLVAASVGFLCEPAGRALHSNITGVLPAGRGRSLGYAVKLHQRAWALDRGYDLITWTFDPLILRNAWLNLAKLAARPREYLVDFYGSMGDGINAGDASDRLYLGWPLRDPVVAAACEGRPAALDAAALLAGNARVLLRVGEDGASPHVLATAGLPAGEDDVALVGLPPDIEGLRARDRGLGRAWRVAVREALGSAMAGGWGVAGIAREGWYVLEAARGRSAGETEEDRS